MAGAASFGIPMGNDKSVAANKARKDALARIALLKKKEMDTATYIAGEVAKLLLPDPATIKRAVKDPSGTLRGAAEIASLTNPSSYIARASNLIQGKGLSLYGSDLEDVGQAAEIAGLIPGGKGVGATFKVAEKGVSAASKGLLRGVGEAASRTSADALSAASGGLLRGSPVRAARTAPEPDEFDAIISAAKAEDPTLGNVVPAGVEPPVFRSELDWDESMSVNYDKARKKITMDLLSRQKGAAGEDPTLINPLIDDSIAALDDEIGNLSMRNYNHNDLEDFLGKVAEPDDYTVADSTLAKRADELVGSIDDDAVVWSVDPEAWLRETGRSGGPEDVRGLLEGLDMGATSPVSEVEGLLNVPAKKVNTIQTLVSKGFGQDPKTWDEDTAKEAKRAADVLWRERIKGDKRKLGLKKNEELYLLGMAQPGGSSVKIGKKGKEGWQTMLPANPINLLNDFFRSNSKYIELNPDAPMALGHDIARSLGGPTSKYNIYYIPAKTNEAMRQLTFKEFIEKQMSETGESMATVKDLWGLSHIYI